MAECKGILVVGDLMIDRSWLVPGRSAISTSQAHGDVPPRKLINPHWETDVLGGAGVVARAALSAMRAAKLDCMVYLASAWKDGFNPGDYVSPEDKKKDECDKEIEFIPVASTPFNTEKFRVYEQSSEGPKLAARYDRDLYPNKHEGEKDGKDADNNKLRPIYTFIKTAAWPDKDNIGVVIVADFGKGLLDLKEVRDKLKEKYTGLPFLLRAKRKAKEEVFTELPWTLALPNRGDLAYLLELDPVELPSFRKTEEGKKEEAKYALNPILVQSLLNFSEKFPTTLEFPKRSVLVKLDREGALLYERNSGDKDQIKALVLPPGQQKLAGIGAGDVFAASLAAKLVEQKTKEIPPDYPEACKYAVARATTFCRGAATISHPLEGGKKGWYGVGVSPDNKTVDEVMEGVDLSKIVRDWSVSVLVGQKEQDSRCQRLLADAEPVRIKNAMWFLDKFLTVEKDLGFEIMRVKSEVRTYFDAQDFTAKPFVMALCGSPGSGKSALAEALADALGFGVIQGNAAQWTSMEDLFRLCEQIRTVRVKNGKAFVFIDEVDTTVAGEKLYGKLLAPLGDGAYSSYGYTRQLGPAVFLLAGSNRPWHAKEELLGPIREEDHPKLRDLVSRFSSPPIEVPALTERRLDAIYLAAFQLRLRFPGIKQVERGVLKLLCESTPKHGPRSIQAVVRLFGALQDPTCVAAKDLKNTKGVQGAIALHLNGPFPDSWRDDTHRVSVI